MLRVLSTHLFLNHRLASRPAGACRPFGRAGSRDLRRPPALRLHQPRARRGAGRVVPLQCARSRFPCTPRSFLTARWAAPARPESTCCTRRNPAASTPWTRSSALWKPPSTSPCAISSCISANETTAGRRAPSSTHITALEHLGAFARPLGVRLLVENLLSEPTTPEHLMTILRDGPPEERGRLPGSGPCTHDRRRTRGHGTLGSRIASVHVHDNHGAEGRAPVARRRNISIGQRPSRRSRRWPIPRQPCWRSAPASTMCTPAQRYRPLSRALP